MIAAAPAPCRNGILISLFIPIPVARPSDPRVESQALCWRPVVMPPNRRVREGANPSDPELGARGYNCQQARDYPADAGRSESGGGDVATRCLGLVLGQAQMLPTLVPLHFPSRCLWASGPTLSLRIGAKRGLTVVGAGTFSRHMPPATCPVLLSCGFLRRA